MEKEKLNRINELAKIKKERPLTPEEDAEKAELYKEYISDVPMEQRKDLKREINHKRFNAILY